MIKDNVAAMNQLTPIITTFNEIIKIKLDGIDRNKIEMSQTLINSTLNHMKNLNDSYIKHEQNLTMIMNKQVTVFETARDSFFPPINVKLVHARLC
jgi:uncharacterized protein YsxB (DUF464 family)